MYRLTSVTTGQTFGPFSAVIAQDNQYLCDGIGYPKSIVGYCTIDPWTDPIDVAFDRNAAARQIDDAVAAIYARAYRFLVEYTDREQAAQAFRDGGYAGPVPERVAEFATPADMPVQAATDLILAQAAALRAAQGKLAGLRMRKYEVLRAGSNVEALDIATTILADIQSVGKGVV